MGRRRYHQYCGLARALDALGERWTLLIVRQLLAGPARFKDLLESLGGIGPNMLTERLKDMEERGLVERSRLPPPADIPVYTLTEKGQALDQVVLALTQWGLRTMAPRETADVARGDWAAMAVKAAFDATAAEGVFETYQFQVEDRAFHLHVHHGVVELNLGESPAANLQITSTAQVLVDMAAGHLDPREALAHGLLKVEGRPGAFQRAAELFFAVRRAPTVAFEERAAAVV